MKSLKYYRRHLEHLLPTFRHGDLEDLEKSRVKIISRTRGGDTITRPSPRSFHGYERLTDCRQYTIRSWWSQNPQSPSLLAQRIGHSASHLTQIV
jgi:hypothetical protein